MDGVGSQRRGAGTRGAAEPCGLPMITRRGALKTMFGLAGAGVSTAAYGLWLEPVRRLDVTEYRIAPPHWPSGVRMRVALVADIHAGDPFMPIDRVAEVVARTNALKPDLIVLLGDYRADHRFVTRAIEPDETFARLAELSAPLGVYGILGNHDYWHGVVPFRAAFTATGIALLENGVATVPTPAGPVFLIGTASMIAVPLGRGRFRGFDDLPGTLAKVPLGAPVLLAAHEPDLFVRVPDRVSLTMSGHTHGGQVRLFGFSPHVPSKYGNRFAYGHVVEDGRHLVVSGGLGLSTIPMRIGVPPEIVLLTLG
ncbi:putative metallophosphoesterase [Blastochloris viridis]|nr:putative metallophosphoesterase [Blastochloris viridis]